MNEIKTYQDFISEVENLVKDGSVDISGKIPENANDNFSFKDMEVGKISVFWVPDYDATFLIWFLYPIEINSQQDYTLYWCYMNVGMAGWKVSPKHRHKQSKFNTWIGKVWNNKRWQIVDDKSSLKDKFINWNNLPWGGEK